MKIVRLIAIIGMVLTLTSCEKEKEEWTRFDGFTKADLLGHYEANPDESVYEEYPVLYMSMHRNAVIDIEDHYGNLINVHVNIPNVINTHFIGVAGVSGYNSEIIMDNLDGDLVMEVYKNDQNQIRLHGRVRRDISSPASKVDIFDVIKKTEDRSKK